MVPLHRLAAPALAFLFLLGSCDRLSTPQETELPSRLDLRFGVWTDSADAARDSLLRDHPHTGSITVGDTLWVRLKAEGDTDKIRSVDAFFSGSWRSIPLPVFFPVSWTDSGLQKVKVGLFTDDDQFFDSLFVRVTDQTPSLRMPTLPGDGKLRVSPDGTTAFFVGTTDDGRVDSLRWDLDGDGTLDTSTLASDTLRLRWTLERILRARLHPFLRVVARDEDGNEDRDSLALDLQAPPPSVTLAGPDTVSVGDTLRFTATATGVVGLLPISWQDGSTGGQWLGFAPAVETTLTLRAIVRDSLGGTDTAAKILLVRRDAPIANAGTDLVAHAGRSLRLSGAATQRFGSIVSWGWDLDNDGVFRTSATSAGIDTTWETTGLRAVVLRIQDDDGNVDLDTLLVNVTDSVQRLSISPFSDVAKRDTLLLSATATDPDGDSLALLWVVDGDTTAGATRRVAFDSVGIHVVRTIARAFTPAGTLLATVTRTDTVLVVADPPKLELGPDTTVAFGGTWRAARATASDSTGTLVSTDWDWNGDGTWDTTTSGFAAPLHRFATDTGRVVVRARVTDDDGNRAVDSLSLRVDPAPWNLALVAPATSPRLAGIVVKLSWRDSATAPASVRWTSNEGLDTTRSAGGDADSVVVQGRLVDTLRLTARLVSRSGAVSVRSIAVVLETLSEGPQIFLTGPDTVSWGDSILIVAETIGNSDPAAIQWWNQTTGFLSRTSAPAKDTVLQLKARVRDALGRTDSAVHTVVVRRDAPTADAGADLVVHAGRSLRLSGAATQRFGSIVSWGWDLDNDGVFRTSATSAGIDTTWETTGLRTVVLRVQDDDGNADLDTLLVNVTDSVQRLSIAPFSDVAKRDTLLLSATATDPDGDSLVLLWVVDGLTTTGATRRVAFDSVGIHVVRAYAHAFTPAGTLLATVTRTDTVLVVADPPKLELGPDTTVAFGGTWRAARATASDSTGTLVSTDWDWNGDGTWDTTTSGFAAPLHRFATDTGRVVVRARVTDDDGNRAVDSLSLRVDPAPWNLALVAPTTSSRLTGIVVKLSWRDSATAPASVRWTSNEGLDTTRSAGGDADSVVVQGRLVDTLRVTARLVSGSGAITTRTVGIVLDSLPEGPRVFLYGPDSVSWNDTIELSAETTGEVSPTDVSWWNQTSGLSAQAVAPSQDTILSFRVWITDNLGREDSATKTVRVIRDAPVANGGTDRSVHAGTLVRLSGAATQSFGSIVSWGWDLNNDGIFRISTSSAGIDTSWETVGPRTVVLRVQDDDGNADLDTLVVTVTDAPPSVVLEVPGTVDAPNPADLLASVSDPDGDSLAVFWVVEGDTLQGATRQASFTRSGPNTVKAIVRSFTRSAGTLLTQTVDSATIVVRSSISVDLQAPDTIWADTLASVSSLQAIVVAPAGASSIQWSFDNGATWAPGSLSGVNSWTPVGFGPKTVIVRALDTYGSSGSDTAVVQHLEDRPVVTMPDSLTLVYGTRSSSIPMSASVRFGGFSRVRWTWTDPDSARTVTQTPTGGLTISSPLVDAFPPGRYVVRTVVSDDKNQSTEDSVVLTVVGLRARFKVAPDSVATGSNLHAEGVYDVWPKDSAVETGFTFDQTDYLDRTVLDTRPPEAGNYPLDFWANFVGSQSRARVSRSVQVVYDPPTIQSFPLDTVAEGSAPNLDFTATRKLGGIEAWVWDLSGATGADNVLQRFATHSNTQGGTLATVPPFLGGSRPVGYGVVDDAGDTTWVVRNFLVVGRPDAVDDVLGLPGRNGLDVSCVVGTNCDIYDDLLLSNDKIGTGLQGTPKVVSALDGASVGSNTDGTYVSLDAPTKAGVLTFRYVISNDVLQDTGTVQITIYERTDAAGLDAKSVSVAFAETNAKRNWGPNKDSLWSVVLPLPDQAKYEYAGLYLEVPKIITGAQLRTPNAKNTRGQDSIAPAGADLHAIDSKLAFYLEHGPTDWMKDEKEVHDVKIRVGTKRSDGLGIPDEVAWADHVLPVTFERLVVPSATVNEKSLNPNVFYDCDGSTSFTYLIDVGAVQNPHANDFVQVSVPDLKDVNNGKGFQDGDITASFTDVSGKVFDIPFKRDTLDRITGTLPITGGSLQIRFAIKGLVPDPKTNPSGEFSMSWLSIGGNPKSDRLTERSGATFPVRDGCQSF